jgi:hypothetical protein
MNIISTVGDLKKALSAYGDDLPLDIFSSGAWNSNHTKLTLNNDYQIRRVIMEDREYLEIALVQEGA